MTSVVKKITQFYMRKGKKQGHEYSHTLCRHTPKTQNRNTQTQKKTKPETQTFSRKKQNWITENPKTELTHRLLISKRGIIYRGYYTVARRYEFYFRVAERAQRVSKILFLPRENKIHIFKPPCNVLFNI